MITVKKKTYVPLDTFVEMISVNVEDHIMKLVCNVSVISME